MTHEKLSFSVENAEMIGENPDSNFAVLSLDFFASGENLHDLYVSEETLMRTADSIKNCPLVWKYDDKLDDVYTHDIDEVPCGFVPETSLIESKKLPDGRTMLSVTAYVWKRYTGELLRIFKRDGGQKPVSVEMIVYKIREMANGLTELLDFRYEGITVLGTFVTPAIPLASATVLSFAQMKDEYNEAYRKEFLYSDINMTIPQEVKNNAKKGLELRKQFGKGGTSVGLSLAKYLAKNITASPEKIKQITKYFSRHKGDNLTDKESNEYISALLFGGIEGKKWSESLSEKMEEQERERMSYVENGLTDEMNRETFNVEKSDKEKSMEKEKELKEKEEEMASEEEVKEEEMASEEMAKDEESKEEMAKDEDKEEMASEEDKEEMAEDEKEDEKEDEEEDEEDKPKKFEFPHNFDAQKALELFGEDESSEIKLAKESLLKEEGVDPSVLISGMFSMMVKLSEENSKLSEFKTTTETKMKAFEVEKTLKELSEKVLIPDDVREELKAEADKYEFSNIEAWKTFCKAKSFDFALKGKDKTDSIDIGLPFTDKPKTKKDDLWS